MMDHAHKRRGEQTLYVFFSSELEARLFAAYADKALKRWKAHSSVRFPRNRTRVIQRLAQRLLIDESPVAVWRYAPPGPLGRPRIYARIRGQMIQLAKRFGLDPKPVERAWRNGQHPPSNEVDSTHQERLL